MKDICNRRTPRRPCRGEVSVFRLAGGEAGKARLVDIGGGGVRLTLERPMAVGEFIRIVFPGRPDRGRSHGRTIIGRIAHSRCGQTGFTVGVEFGWHAATSEASRTRRADPPGRPFFGLFSWLIARTRSRGQQLTLRP